MKIALHLFALVLIVANCSAQSQIISKDEYEKVFQFAVSETNADYPFIFKVTTNFFEDGKAIRTTTEVNENESQGYRRSKRTVLSDGKATTIYQITAGFGNVFCSNDELLWKSSKYECDRVRMIYARREPESVKYAVTKKKISGKQVKIYREFLVFAASENDKTKYFSEKVSVIDSRGFFLTVVDVEGTLEPKTVTLKREQIWLRKAKIKPIIAPKIS